MSIWKFIADAKDLTCAVALDVVSLGGTWLVNGQSKTGEFIDNKAREGEADPELVAQLIALALKKEQGK